MLTESSVRNLWANGICISSIVKHLPPNPSEAFTAHQNLTSNFFLVDRGVREGIKKRLTETLLWYESHVKIKKVEFGMQTVWNVATLDELSHVLTSQFANL